MRLLLSPGERIDLGSSVVPGSKSHTIRALFASLAADGSSTLLGPLDSADTVAAREAVHALGSQVDVNGGIWAIEGTGGKLAEPLAPLSAGESGLTARHLVAFAALVRGRTVITADGRLPLRPMTGVLDAVERQGAATSHTYPWVIDGRGAVPGGPIEVDGTKSSQMVSAILMTAPLADNPTILSPLMKGSHGYLQITTDVMGLFHAEVEEGVDGKFRVGIGGYQGTTYSVPPDASAAVYPFAAAAMTGGEVTVPGDLSGQPDANILEFLEQVGCRVSRSASGTHLEGPDSLTGLDADLAACPDGAVALAVVCATAETPSRLQGLGSLRLKESDRLFALETELTRFGAKIATGEDWITITPGAARSARFETHNDHRVAMSLGLLGLRHEGIEIVDAGVVGKTWPRFWDWLAGAGCVVTTVGDE